MAERIAIVGVGQTEFKGRRPDISQVELVNQAVRAALDNAQLTIKDIDAVVIGNVELFEGNYQVDMWMTEGSGAYLKSGFKVQSGGTTGSTVSTTCFNLAASGEFGAVLGIGFEKQDEGSSQASLRSIYEDVFYDVGGGGKSAVTGAQGIALDMLRRKSITEEQVAIVRVKQAENAIRNPHAHLRRKLTVEDVMNSPLLARPLRLLHICPTSVGACAIVVAPESSAKKISSNPAWVIDWVTVHGGTMPFLGTMTQAISATPLGPMWLWSFEQAATKLYKRNGITNPRRELDVIEVYDMATWLEIEWYERTHLCEKNEAHKLVEEQATWMGGDIPVNPSGGVVSTNAIGASAMQRIAEIAIQIRGDGGDRQVPNAKQAAAFTAGGDNYSTAVLMRKLL
ncbi:MAG: thiolase family protein [Thermodesulfobacteriota bacterium]|jgi:acetyl-CoA C-acetyltransferase